jgi:hypothetical protein
MSPIEFKRFIDILKPMFPFSPEMDAAQLTAWYSYFEEIPASSAYAAIPHITQNCDRFPSIKQLQDAIQPKPDHDAEARVIVDKIWTAIERFGSARNKDEKIREAIGDLGMRVVKQLGGWLSVCNCANYDDASTIKAQWRESAKAMLHIEQVDERRSALGLPPSAHRETLPARDEVPENMKAILSYMGRSDV